jgi:hypothetical protein
MISVLALATALGSKMNALDQTLMNLGLLGADAPVPPRRPSGLISNPESGAGFNYDNETIGGEPSKFDVRDSILKAISDVSEVLPGNKSLMLLTAAMESRVGDDENWYKFKKVKDGTVGHGGPFQVTDGSFRAIQKSKNPRMLAAKKAIKDSFGIDISKINKDKVRTFLENPLHSAIAARLQYKMSPKNVVPDNSTPEVLFNAWKEQYHKGEKSWKKNGFGRWRRSLQFLAE